MTRHLTRWLCALALLLASAVPVWAAFSAGVAPPRFELAAQPGETLRELLTIYNSGDVVETYLIRTADWDLTPDGGVVIHPPELQPGSCRPWARIERREITVLPGSIKRFRFEIALPPDTPAGECRLALLIEAKPPELLADDVSGFSVRVPINARLAVIVYVVVGDARAELRFESASLREVRGGQVPVVRMSNTGNAHGRPGGFVTAEDARAERYDLVVTPTPILPGRSVEVMLRPDPKLYGESGPDWQPPLRLRGTVETGFGDQPLDLQTR